MHAKSNILERITSNLYQGEDEVVADLVQQALDQEMSPGEILNGGLIAGMDEVGRDFILGVGAESFS